MKLKFAVSLLMFAFFFGAAAQAQDLQRVDVSVAYSYVRYNPSTFGVKSFSMNGASGSAAYNFNRWLSGVADFGGYTSRVNGTLSTYLFGPRLSVNRNGRVTPFAQVLVGAAHAGNHYLTTGVSQTAFSTAVGGGLDWRLTHHLHVRAGEVDYLLTHLTEVNIVKTREQNNLRVSSGLVLSF